jgi:hypothetical protein
MLVCAGAMWGSIEWIIPICSLLTEMYHPHTSITFLIFRDDKEDLLKGNLELENSLRTISGQPIIDLCDLLPRPVTWLLDRISRVIRRIKILRRFEKRIYNKSIVFLKKLLWRRSIRKWLGQKNYSICLSDVLTDNVFKHELKKRKINIGYYPTAPSFVGCPDLYLDHEKVVEQKLNFVESGFDFFLTDTKWAYDIFKSVTDKSVFNIGAPAYDSYWLKNQDNKEYGFFRTIGENSNGIKIVCLLKNESAINFKFIDFYRMLKEILEVCLQTADVVLIVKPHPRQNEKNSLR